MLEKKNNCYIVGELVEYNLAEKSYLKDGVTATAIAGNIVVHSVINGESLYNKLDLFVSKLTKQNTINKNYELLMNAKDLMNKRVIISSARIKDERFWTREQQIATSNKIDCSFSFIKLAGVKDSEDKATFELSGVVAKELVEVELNGDLLGYKLMLAQSNFSDTNMIVIPLWIDKDNIGVINAVRENYTFGSTVSINGIIRTRVETVRTSDANNVFGEPIVKVITKTDKKFVILGGQEVIHGEGEYTEEIIEALNKAYVAEGVAIKTKALGKETEAKTAPVATKSKTASLAGLI